MEILELEVLDAIVQVAVLGAYADGHLADEERAVLQECVATHAANEEECRTMLSFVARLPERHARANSEERDRRINEVLSVLTTKETRERAFRLAVDVAAAHQGIRIRESQVLLQLMFDLSIDGALAQRLMRETKAGRDINGKSIGATLKSNTLGSDAPKTETDPAVTRQHESERPSESSPITPPNAQ